MSGKKRIWKYLGLLVLVLVVTVSAFLLLVKQSLPHTAGTMTEGSCQDLGEGAGSGHEPRTQRILVTYASKYSSTASVAEAVMATLCDDGFMVDLRWVQNVEDVTTYDGVVLGSPIYWGFWLPTAMDFLEQQGQILANRKVAYFILANVVANDKDTPENRKKAMDVFVAPVLEDFPAIKPIGGVGIFGGRIEHSNLTGFESLMMDLFGFEDNDSRNFAKVKAWSEEVARAFAKD